MYSRLALALPLMLALTATASAQGLTPEEAVKRMKLPEGFSARCVAHEPMIRQPTSMSFDNRGRMWVLQYLQYPNYAGLKPVKQDQYLRTIWDKIPEPPPHGPKGLDRITICYDPDEHGVFRKSKDFVTGLNIASGFCIGHGGVYVVQPPYLLFYPDKNEDDVPDGDPEVLLSGFGMDDTHSLANSLQWGPDGWLYGAAGSTSTCKIKNLANPERKRGGESEIVEFQQGIWRFHPKTKKFELFSEGGGNTYGLDFDRNGQVIAGTNYGGYAFLHQMQGAYYVKGFAKHGPLHNPHTYGYFEHVPYTGFKGGHVTCGGIVYQADVYPEQYRNQYIAANLLSNGIYWHKIEAVKSSFKASHGGELIEANDPWFRPIDCLQGPDGCVYVVDFYDRRAAHLDPVDNWDKSNGRIYRIEYKGGPNYPTFDLRKKTTAELLELLKHPNVWYRREVRQLLAERKDKSSYDTLRKWAKDEKGQLALEALWTLYISDEINPIDDPFLINSLTHSEEYVRAWALRLLGDNRHGTVGDKSPEAIEWLPRSARQERSLIVLAQLACTAKREDHITESIVAKLLQNPAVQDDPQLSLLIWWAAEATITRTPGDSFLLAAPQTKLTTLQRQTTERIARRLMASDLPEGPKLLARLLDRWQEHDPAPLLAGMLQGLQSSTWKEVPELLRGRLAELRKSRPNDATVLEILARMRDPEALADARKRAASATADAARISAIDLLRQVRDTESKAPFIAALADTKSDAVKLALLAALEGYDDPKIGETVLAAYAGYSPAVKKRAVQLMLARPTWALPMLKAFDAGKFPKTDLSVDQGRIAVGLGDKDVTAIVEKHFGKIAPATAGEKQARITWLSVQIPREKAADAARGKVLFTKHCAACHQLHGEGGKVGPDLTTADRKNRGYLIAQIVDPSGYIRPEFVVQNVLTTDERKLLGIAKEVGESVELSNWVDNKVVTTLVAKKDIADIRPSAVSLMPEKILDTLSDAEIADLFAYLMLEAPKKDPGVKEPSGEKQPPTRRGASLAATSPSRGEVKSLTSPLEGEVATERSEAAGGGFFSFNLPNTPSPRGDKDAKKLKIALISGSFEYKSDDSLAAFKKHLEATYPVECTLVSAKSDKDLSLAGIEALEKCDVAVFFTRRLQIEGEALDAVKKYVSSKKPIVGIRTASHGFQKWLEMDKDVLGGDYKGHFGAGVAEVKPIEKQKDHPILKGVSAFKTNGSLYKNPNVATDVNVILQGYMGKETEPVAWTREKDGRRVFYTSLGHPDDFKDENFIRLLVNGIAWATKTELKK